MSPTIRELPSPNHDARPSATPIDTLILHYTGMQTACAAIDRLRDQAARISAHFAVDEHGAVFQLVPEDRRAWHSGVAFWRGHTDLNDRSIGVAIVNPGHEWGYRDFPVLQLAAVCDLCLGILARHPIAPRNVVAHSDVAPDRRQDPGEKFPWQDFARNGVGLWPEDGVEPIPNDAAALRHALATIGFGLAADGPPDAALATVLRAFQRHWRSEEVNGQADPGTRSRLAGVVAAVMQSDG